MESTKEKVSYCIGLDIGTGLGNQYAEMDLERLIEGLQDAINRREPQLQKDEVQNILLNLRNQVELKRRETFAKIGAENRKAGDEFLRQNAEKEGIHTLPSGLQYRILSSGPSAGAHPTPLDTVKVDYRGSFIDGRVFDSSYQRGEPVVTTLNRVMAGWTELLQLMRIGDKWQAFVPSYLAYGEFGLQNVVGPNVTLIFEIELLAINPR
jgi:FKBP-type peptidyl-prolyl cis-trans isomerase FklB